MFWIVAITLYVLFLFGLAYVIRWCGRLDDLIGHERDAPWAPTRPSLDIDINRESRQEMMIKLQRIRRE